MKRYLIFLLTTALWGCAERTIAPSLEKRVYRVMPGDHCQKRDPKTNHCLEH